MPYHYKFTRSNPSSTSIDIKIATIATELNTLQANIKNPEAIIDDLHELDHRLEDLLDKLKVINRVLPLPIFIDRHQIDTQD
jgi:hypothetical protein